jgi:type II secretory pathway component PulL
VSSSADQRLDALRERVEEQEVELHDAVQGFEDVARRAIDARQWIRSRPYLWAVGAFLVGAWLGGRKA